MIFALLAAMLAAATALMVYAALWGLLMEHMRLRDEPQDDSRYYLEE